MSSTKKTKSASDPRKQVYALDVRLSVACIITDEEENLNKKKAVVALSQTRDINKHLQISGFVLIGAMFVLIAANIGISVVVARLTRQFIVDPVIGMATIPGSDNVVMKTSTALYKQEDVSFHSVPTEYLSTLEAVVVEHGNLSFDVKGYAHMSNETIILVEGDSFIFDITGLQNVTGDELTRLFSSIIEERKSIDLDGRQLGHWGGPYWLCAGLVTKKGWLSKAWSFKMKKKGYIYIYIYIYVSLNDRRT